MTSSRRCSTSAPPEITFFTDRDLGLQFPSILRQAGLRVERHADHFAATSPDEEWLEAVARRGWTAVTHDARIRYKPNELAAVDTHKAALLVVVGRAPHAALAHSFVATIPRILSFLAAHQPPFIALHAFSRPSDSLSAAVTIRYGVTGVAALENSSQSWHSLGRIRPERSRANLGCQHAGGPLLGNGRGFSRRGSARDARPSCAMQGQFARVTDKKGDGECPRSS